jgi:hypothetical protein
MTAGHVDHAVKMLVGEVHALNMIMQSLVKTHPEPEKLLAQLDEAEPRGLASLEYLPVHGEALIDGYQFVMDVVRGRLRGPGEVRS